MPDHFRPHVGALGHSPNSSKNEEPEHPNHVQVSPSPIYSGFVSRLESNIKEDMINNNVPRHKDTARQSAVTNDDVTTENDSEEKNLVIDITDDQDSNEVPLALVVRKTVQVPNFDVKDDIAPPNVTIGPNFDNGGWNRLKIRDFAKVEDAIKTLGTPRGAVKRNSTSDSDYDSDLSSNNSQTKKTLDDSPKLFTCKHCYLVFSHLHQLADHMGVHKDESHVNCNQCKDYFDTKTTENQDSYICHLCNKDCKDMTSLGTHLKSHMIERPYVCSICSKAYSRKSHLDVHTRSHSGERPYVCLECALDFTEKRFLNDHIQTSHTGRSGPLQCPNCHRDFSYKSSLTQHLKNQLCSKNIVKTGKEHKQFDCPFCQKSYSWKQTLKQHVFAYHRDKVEQDEFWKFELSKHGRNVINEDMWRRQLGKHAAGEMPAQKTTKNSILSNTEPKQSDSWLGRVDLSTARPDVSKITMIALRSLEASLGRTRPNTFVTLENPSTWVSQNTETGSGLRLEMTKNIQGEPPSKRTRLWLEQLEQSQTTDDVQLKRKVPDIKIEEITIADTDDERVQKQANNFLPVNQDKMTFRSLSSPTPYSNNNNNNNTNSSNSIRDLVIQSFKTPIGFNNNNNNNYDSNAVSNELPATAVKNPDPNTDASSPRGMNPYVRDEGSGSLLKAILMDKATRRRRIPSPPCQPVAQEPGQEQITSNRFVPKASEILRNRLLGLDLDSSRPDLQRLSCPAQVNPEVIQNQSSIINFVQNNDQGPSLIPDEQSVDKSDQPKYSYKNTAVMKQMLHRYNESIKHL